LFVIDSFVPSLSLSSLLFLSYQTHTHTHPTSVCLSACLSCVLSSPLLPLFHSFFSSSSLLLIFLLSPSDSPLHRSRLLIYSFFVGFSRMPVGRRGASSLHSLVPKRASSSRTPRKSGGEKTAFWDQKQLPRPRPHPRPSSLLSPSSARPQRPDNPQNERHPLAGWLIYNK